MDLPPSPEEIVAMLDFSDVQDAPALYQEPINGLILHLEQIQDTLLNMDEPVDVDLLVDLYCPTIKEGQDQQILTGLVRSVLLQVLGRSSRDTQLLVRKDLYALAGHDRHLADMHRVGDGVSGPEISGRGKFATDY